MKINGFIWLEDIVEKLAAKHQVAPEEVEQIFSNYPGIRRMKKGHFRGEDVYRALGQTDGGATWWSSSFTSCLTRP
ncbi:MAG: hypothetical protein Fur0021_22930 [Candidatus Promineifilaceae bacterium]